MCQDFPKREVSATDTGEVSPRRIRRRKSHAKAKPWCDVSGPQSVNKCRPSRSEKRRIRAWTRPTQSLLTTCMTSQTRASKPLILLIYRTLVQRHHSFISQRDNLRTIKRSLVNLKTPKVRSVRSATTAMKHHLLSSTAINKLIVVANRCEYKRSKKSNSRVKLKWSPSKFTLSIRCKCKSKKEKLLTFQKGHLTSQWSKQSILAF